MPEVKQAVVMVREHPSGDRRLVAYLVPAGAPGPAATDLQAFLQKRLPTYMIPAEFIPLDALPLTHSGKVDRRALPEPEWLRAGDPQGESTAPANPLEEVLAGIWADVLSLDHVGVHEDFFALGGHSMMATLVIARIRIVLGLDLPLLMMIRYPTVRAFATVILDGSDLSGRVALCRLAAGRGRPLFLVHPVGGEILSYIHLARELGDEREVYGLQVPDQKTPCQRIEEMAAIYLRSVQEVQPEGPYTLGGWSMGGSIAFEMARQLESQGKTVDRVILIDAYAPRSQAELISDRDLNAAFVYDLARLWGMSSTSSPLDVARIEEALGRLGEQAEILTLVAPEMDATSAARHYKLFEANYRAAERYVGGACASPLLLIRAAEIPQGSVFPEPDLGWGRLAQQPVEICEIPGDHYTLLREPAVTSLAALILERVGRGD